jgi:hypothetical protein
MVELPDRSNFFSPVLTGRQPGAIAIVLVAYLLVPPPTNFA